jgi:hypothetical protein
MHVVPFVAPSSFPLIAFANVALQAEVSLLWVLADVFPNRTSRGNDPRDAIEAQLCVLADELNLSQVLAEFKNEQTDAYVLEAAIEAAVWLQKGGEAPSTGWLRLMNKGE